MEKRLDTIDLFLKILSRVSITPDDDGLLDYIRDYLAEFEAIWVNKGGVKNLFLTKKFGDGKHICFVGHVDIVPAGDGWRTNPFVPVIDGDYIYARGTQDMKSGVVAMVQACRDLENFNGRVSIMLTSDEEGDGTYGLQILLRHLKEIDLLPDYCLIGEPTCEEVFGDAIKVGRRGSINGEIVIKGRQGHAAYPEKSINPIHQVAPILDKIAGVNLDSGDNNFAPSKIVLTDIRGGMEVTNVTPSSLKIMFNIRNSTKISKDSVKEYIEELFSGLDYSLKLEQSSFPFVTDRDSALIENLNRAIFDITGVKAKLSTAGGTSDGRHIAPYGIDVVEFGVINDRIHAVDERTTIYEVESLYRVYKRFISLMNN